MKVYVGNLPYQLSDDDLIAFFESGGISADAIDDIALIKDRETGRLRGFGFVTFVNQEAVDQALKMDGNEMNGRPLRINMVRDRDDGGDRRRG
jgi:cold-inducible RNA-binding protein